MGYLIKLLCTEKIRIVVVGWCTTEPTGYGSAGTGVKLCLKGRNALAPYFHLSVPMAPEYCGRYVDLVYSYTEFLQQFHLITASQCDNHTRGSILCTWSRTTNTDKGQ